MIQQALVSKRGCALLAEGVAKMAVTSVVSGQSLVSCYTGCTGHVSYDCAGVQLLGCQETALHIFGWSNAYVADI